MTSPNTDETCKNPFCVLRQCRFRHDADKIKEIEDQVAKSSPEKALEKALQDARSSSAQSVSQKAA